MFNIMKKEMKDKIIKKAEKVRKEVGMEEDVNLDLETFVKSINNKRQVNIKIYEYDLSEFNNDFEESISGLIDSEGKKVNIIINKYDYENRKRFTIAHELGHYFLHHDNSLPIKHIDLRSSMDMATSKEKEQEANFFAAELLMPGNLIKKEYYTEKNIIALAKIFGVSKEAMNIRLKELGLKND